MREATLLTDDNDTRVVSAELDTAAHVTLISQRLAVELGLEQVDAELPTLRWLESQHMRTYGAYEIRLTLQDDYDVEKTVTFLAYGTDKDGPDLLVGMHTLQKHAFDIYCGSQTWKWGLREHSIKLVALEDVEKSSDPVYWVGHVHWSISASGKPTVRVRSVKDSPVQLPKALEKWAFLFDNESAAILPQNKATDHAINLQEGKEPPYGPLYSLSQRELEILREYLERELANGRIQYSTSPAGAPILFVPKQDGSLRLCVDYRALNSVTIKDRCPIPLINETLDRLIGAWYFTTLDLKDAYHRIRIREGDEWKTAFRTRYGHFEYKVMPFGLTNAPATFQAYINRALAGLLDDVCVVYLDDILIYTHSRSLEEHWAAVEKVLERLERAQLYANLKKCTFASDTVSYLGFLVTREGVKADPSKIDTIVSWPVPENVKDVQVFLGFANFYRRFIEAYSKVVSPITDLLKHQDQFVWGPEAQRAFERLKEMFFSAPVMRHFDPSLRMRLETDASQYGLSGILSQLSVDGKWHPVAFTSRKMQPAERNYEVYDQELLAIVHSFKTWRQYIEGAKHAVEVYTDHNNLKGIQSVQRLNPRQARWAVYLGSFDFSIHHRAGKTNPADGPSRRPDYFTVNQAVNNLLPTLQHKLRLASGSALVQVIRVASARVADDGAGGSMTDEMSDTVGGPPTALGSAAVPTPAAGNAGCKQRVPRWTARVLLSGATAEDPAPRSFVELIRSLQHDDPFTQKKIKNPNLKGTDRRRANNWHCGDDELLRYRNRIYVPQEPSVRTEILTTHHDSMLAGHFGVKKTYDLVFRYFFWPELRNDVETYIKTCAVCQRTKSPRRLPIGKLSSLPVPEQVLEEITLDFITGLPPSKHRKEVFDSILVIVDRLSKLALYIPANKDWKARDFSESFERNFISKYGIPKGIVSDRGSLFTSAFWTEICYQAQIRRRLSTAYHPQTDGQTERQNQTLEQYLRSFCGEAQDDWASLLHFAEFAYNNAVHASTGQTPFMMIHGKHPRWDPLHEDMHHEGEAPAATERWKWLQEIRDMAMIRLEEAQQAQQRAYDQAHRPEEFKQGDKVLLSTKNLKLKQPSRKLSNLFIGPFVIEERIGSQAYRLRLPPKYKIHDVFHVSLLKAYHHREGEPEVDVAEPDLIAEDGEKIWEVERILDERTVNGERQYLLKWKGYGDDWDQWEPESSLENADELLAEWSTAKAARPRRGRPKRRT